MRMCQMSEANPLEEFVLRYRDDPALFVQEVLGATPHDYQAEFLRDNAAQTLLAGWLHSSVTSS